MSLFSRLTNPAAGEEKLPVHQFQSALADWEMGGTGAMNRAAVIAAFNITASEETQLDLLKGIYQDATTAGRRELFMQAFHNVLMLAEQATFYTTAGSIQSRLQHVADGT